MAKKITTDDSYAIVLTGGKQYMVKENDTVEVELIDSIYLEGYWLKRIHTNHLTVLIEGIGSTSSLQHGWSGWETGRIGLWCFALNGLGGGSG